MDDREQALEDQAAAQAVVALNAAHRRARASGLPIVMVIGDQLCRVVGASPPEVIRTLPPRLRVAPGAKKELTQ